MTSLCIGQRGGRGMTMRYEVICDAGPVKLVSWVADMGDVEINAKNLCVRQIKDWT